MNSLIISSILTTSVFFPIEKPGIPGFLQPESERYSVVGTSAESVAEILDFSDQNWLYKASGTSTGLNRSFSIYFGDYRLILDTRAFTSSDRAAILGSSRMERKGLPEGGTMGDLCFNKTSEHKHFKTRQVYSTTSILTIDQFAAIRVNFSSYEGSKRGAEQIVEHVRNEVHRLFERVSVNGKIELQLKNR